MFTGKVGADAKPRMLLNTPRTCWPGLVKSREMLRRLLVEGTGPGRS